MGVFQEFQVIGSNCGLAAKRTLINNNNNNNNNNKCLKCSLSTRCWFFFESVSVWMNISLPENYSSVLFWSNVMFVICELLLWTSLLLQQSVPNSMIIRFNTFIVFKWQSENMDFLTSDIAYSTAGLNAIHFVSLYVNVKIFPFVKSNLFGKYATVNRILHQITQRPCYWSFNKKNNTIDLETLPTHLHCTYRTYNNIGCIHFWNVSIYSWMFFK